jgi:hypothetical protein
VGFLYLGEKFRKTWIIISEFDLRIEFGKTEMINSESDLRVERIGRKNPVQNGL